MEFYHGNETYHFDDLLHGDIRSTNFAFLQIDILAILIHSRLGGWAGGVKIKIKDHLSPAEAGIEG